LKDSDEKLFREPAIKRIRQAVAGDRKAQKRLLDVISKIGRDRQSKLALLVAAIQQDMRKAPAGRKK
jgi:hypothetical protein